jgi:hypothetical protein
VRSDLETPAIYISDHIKPQERTVDKDALKALNTIKWVVIFLAFLSVAQCAQNQERNERLGNIQKALATGRYGY